jgi:hypothetical protein
MQRKLVSIISMVAIPIMIVCGLLFAPSSSRVAASSPRADDVDRKVCSNRTLHGDYGSASAGVLLGVPGLPPEAQFQSVGVSHFDGNGNFTGVEHTVINGTPLELDWTANSGTYSVNSNCTGTLVLNTPNSPVPLSLFFVVVRHGTEFHTVLNASAIATEFIKVE